MVSNLKYLDISLFDRNSNNTISNIPDETLTEHNKYIPPHLRQSIITQENNNIPPFCQNIDMKIMIIINI